MAKCSGHILQACVLSAELSGSWPLQERFWDVHCPGRQSLMAFQQAPGWLPIHSLHLTAQLLLPLIIEPLALGGDRGLSSVQKARPGPSHPPACTPRLAAWHCHCFWKQRGEGWCRPRLPSQSCLLPTSPGLLFHPTPRMTGRMQAWPPGSGCGLTKTRTKEVNTGPFPTVYII